MWCAKATPIPAIKTLLGAEKKAGNWEKKLCEIKMADLLARQAIRRSIICGEMIFKVAILRSSSFLSRLFVYSLLLTSKKKRAASLTEASN